MFCLWSSSQNVMEQFNPGLRNLVNLGKNYEKSVTGKHCLHHLASVHVLTPHTYWTHSVCVAAMTLAGKVYFDAVAKMGENAMVSPVSRDLGESHTNAAISMKWED